MTLPTISSAFFLLGLPLAGFLALLAFFSMAVTTVRISRRYGSASWILAPAVVEQSEVTIKGLGRGQTMYVPTIAFRYEWHGISYVSTSISPDLFYAGSTDRSFAEKWVNILPMGARITAYVDENRPEIAVLFPEYRYGWWYAAIVSFAVFGLCTAVALLLFTQYPNAG